jgi:hypothetical protein
MRLSNTYNGWRNRETWLVNLWYGDACIDIDHVREILEEMVENLGNGILQDMLDLDCIDWDELRESWEDTDGEE